MVGDFRLYSQGPLTSMENRQYTVASGTTSSINAGEPVLKALGAAVVTTSATAKPVVGTDYLAGIASTNSTETTTAAGLVNVDFTNDSKASWVCSATTPANIATQALYNALVGARVTYALTSGVFTINTTDGSTNGLVIEPMNITEHPGKIRVSFREATHYLS